MNLILVCGFFASVFFSSSSAFPSFAPGDTRGGDRYKPGNRSVEPYDVANHHGAAVVFPPAPPGPLQFDGAKLVDDEEHLYIPPGKDDMRGPCPGLNTLANHGYLPRNGIVTPKQIVTACMEGYNFLNVHARNAAYQALLSSGNPLTDLISIGGKSPKTGPDPPAPAIAGGLSAPEGILEGDGSMTRLDAFLGNNYKPKKKLFKQFKEFSHRYGGGYYNLTVASKLRLHRIKQSIAQNPERHARMYLESSGPATVFIDGRITHKSPLQSTGQIPGHLDMASAKSFMVHHRFPRGFWRAAKPITGASVVDDIFADALSVPGRNFAGVNTFREDFSEGRGVGDDCGSYKAFVRFVVKQYPKPTGVLRRNLNVNFQYLYETYGVDGVFDECPQLFPYGK